jgi:hypothetical protein
MKLKLGLTSGPTARRDGSGHRTDDARTSTGPICANRLDKPDRQKLLRSTKRLSSAYELGRMSVHRRRFRSVRTSGGQTFS